MTAQTFCRSLLAGNLLSPGSRQTAVWAADSEPVQVPLACKSLVSSYIRGNANDLATFLKCARFWQLKIRRLRKFQRPRCSSSILAPDSTSSLLGKRPCIIPAVWSQAISARGFWVGQEVEREARDSQMVESSALSPWLEEYESYTIRIQWKGGQQQTKIL